MNRYYKNKKIKWQLLFFGKGLCCNIFEVLMIKLFEKLNNNNNLCVSSLLLFMSLN